jgi:peptidoglycan/LPS O-acetylase OafA/YrhL
MYATMPPQLHDTHSHQVWLWTFLVNWTQPFNGGVYGFGHFWSLAVEEQFYLLWPFLVLRCTPANLLRACAAAVAIALLTRLALVAMHFPPDTLYMFTLCRMDALALGAAGAALIRIPSSLERLRRWSPAVAGGALLMLLATTAGTRGLAMYDVSTQTIGYTLLSIAFALAVLAAVLPAQGVLGWGTRVLSWKPLRLIGRYSYGMYVFHLPLHVFFGGPLLHRYFPQPTVGQSLLYTAAVTLATFLLAALSYELFERRFLDLKRKLMPKQLREESIGLPQER